MTLLKLMWTSPIEMAIMLTWMVSVVLAGVVAVHASIKARKESVFLGTELVNHGTMVGMMFGASQILSFMSIMGHAGIEHGWTFHIVQEYHSVSFFFAALGNIGFWFMIYPALDCFKRKQTENTSVRQIER